MTTPSPDTAAGRMTEHEIRAALDGLFAYDSGAVDSGTHDEALRQRVKDQFPKPESADRRALVARLVREMWLTDEAIDDGYGAEDARAFIDWLDEQGLL